MPLAWPSSTRALVNRKAAALADRTLSSLVYQSRASAPQSDQDLNRLVGAARTRNQAEGLTGVLVYDKGRFLQWLEGPTDALRRVWRSICKDRRHTAISLVESRTEPARHFSGSAMALAQRSAPDDPGSAAVLGLPAQVIETLYGNPSSASSLLAGFAAVPVPARRPAAPQDFELIGPGSGALTRLVHEVVVPKLIERHLPPPSALARIDPAARELARLLIAAQPDAATALIMKLRSDGRSLTQLCAGLFEPAARALGELWQADDCSELQVTLGLGRLQVALRKAGHDLPPAVVPPLPPTTPHAVLVAPSPREQHLLGSAMASELFSRAGWDVSYEFPASDAALGRLVHDHWFDVLDLSLSSAFTREARLPAMAASIRTAHAESLNPALTVIVDGRIFHERPWAFANVGADASSDSVMDVVSTAQHQMRRPRGGLPRKP